MGFKPFSFLRARFLSLPSESFSGYPYYVGVFLLPLMQCVFGEEISGGKGKTKKGRVSWEDGKWT